MRRYLRLYAYFVRFSFSRAMEFRLDFFFRIFMDLQFYIVNILFYRLIYSHTDLLGGWNERQILIFIGIYIVMDALHMTVFSNNCWWMPIFVNKGDMDYYLVRPVSSLFFLSLREFAANSFVNLILALSIFGYALWAYPEPFGFGQVVMALLLVVMGTFLYFLLHWMALMPVFWTHSARGMMPVFFAMTRFIEKPDRIFTGVARLTLLTILPFSVMASYPARLIIEDFSWSVFLHLSGITVIFGVLVVLVWNKALAAYSSASS